MPAMTPWWEALHIRDEVIHSSGQIDDVQMSLFQAVYGDGDERPPYADAAYYGEITHPSPQFIDLIAKVAVRLGGGERYSAAAALWRLDQAMGGGKSHGLIGLHHCAADPVNFAKTDVGGQALGKAEQIAGGAIAPDLHHPRVVVLACDNMTAGKGVEEYDGPATTLYERFLWRLFDGDYNLYKEYKDFNGDKSKIVEALRAVDRPVLILVDEIMDYVRQLSDSSLHDLAVKDMAFLRALLDSANGVAHVAAVVVMIATERDSMDLDPEGQSRRAELDDLLIRNGNPATINDPGDFAAILRRRLFDQQSTGPIADAAASAFASHMTGPWATKVFDVLALQGQTFGWVTTWQEEVERCYPFHPHLVALAEKEWSKLAGFQKVRSTIRIFAATVYTLSQRAARGQWAPALIGPGDLPLSEAAVREAIIGSGLITDTRTGDNYRSIAAADVVDAHDQQGAARSLDLHRTGALFTEVNPRAGERAATCLFLCSIVGSRGGGRQGASEAELRAATFVPNAAFGYADADGVLNELKDVDAGGLASVEVLPGKGGQLPRLFMSTRQTLNMLFRASRGTITDEERDAEVARTAERLANSGTFKERLFVSADEKLTPRQRLETAGVDDARSTRLVVLDARQFSLLNGIDKETREALRAALGLGSQKMPVRWASSAIFAVANTQRRAVARGAALNYLAWERVSDMAEVKADEELLEKARTEKSEARRFLDAKVRQAYQHVIYLDVGHDEESGARVDKVITFEHENESALDGTTVWKALVEAGKAFEDHAFNGKALVHNLRDDDFGRPLDEVRDLFWSTPRMPLLPLGEGDLQIAIFEAVKGGTLRLLGSDGLERSVSSPGEVGVGQASLRLGKPVEAATDVEITNRAGLFAGQAGSNRPAVGAHHGEGDVAAGASPQATEKEVAFSLMTSVTDASKRDALYALLQTLADSVDEGAASYAQIMIKLRVRADAAESIVGRARDAGVT